MNFEINKLLQEKAVPFEVFVKNEELHDIGGKLGDEGAFVSGEIKKLAKGTFLVDFTLTTTMTYPCARCLEPTLINCSYAYSDTVTVEDDEVVLNLIPIVEECIYINEPFRILCSDDCQGLCPKCGKNLNEEQCECNQTGDIDPRFEALNKLLF